MLPLLSQVLPTPQLKPQVGSHTQRPRVGSQTWPAGQAPPQVGSGSQMPLTAQNPPFAVFQTQPGILPHVFTFPAVQWLLPPDKPQARPGPQAQPLPALSGHGQLISP